MSSPPRRILVAQIGARRHYAVPLALQAEGWLHRLYTDACADIPPWSLLNQAWPDRFPLSRSLRSLAGRKLGVIPLKRLRGFPWFALSGSWDRRPGEQQTDRWARRNSSFCKLAVLEGLEGADTVYAFNGAALELFREAKTLGLRTVLDQTAAPWRWNSALLHGEQNRWPGWEDQSSEIDHSGKLSRREEAEWELADQIICGSAFARDALQGVAGKAHASSVVPYPCRIRQSQALPLEGSLSGEGKRSHPDEFHLLFVGTLQLRKGLPYLLEALRILNDSRLRVRLVGPSLLSSKAMDELATCCEIIGPVVRSDIQQHYQWADAFVLPTLSEGSANVVYEALAAGLPVVTTPSAGSIVEHKQNGLIIPPGSAVHLAEALGELLNSHHTRARLAANALRSLAEHDWDAYRRRLVDSLG